MHHLRKTELSKPGDVFENFFSSGSATLYTRAYKVRRRIALLKAENCVV
jgi:hypothetical protein